MNNFINIEDYDASIHREILDALLRKESPTYDPHPSLTGKIIFHKFSGCFV